MKTKASGAAVMDSLWPSLLLTALAKDLLEMVQASSVVTFPIKFQCVVFRPFKGEILEAMVTMVNKVGFFAEAGTVTTFVSNHLTPDDMEFYSGDIPKYTTFDGSVRIQRDSEVRLKIIGTSMEATEIFCVGSITGDYLGVTKDPAAAAE